MPRVAGVTMLAHARLYAIANRDAVPAANLRELAAWIRGRSKPVFYASVGPGSLPHLVALAVEQSLNVKMMHVPYPGAAAARTDLIAGRVQLMFDQIAQFQGLDLAGGPLRVLAVLARQREREFPDVPSAGEAGWPELAYSFWAGLIAPRATPPEIVEPLGRAAIRVVTRPATSALLARFGLHLRTSTPQAFDRWIAAESSRWQPLANAARRALQERQPPSLNPTPR